MEEKSWEDYKYDKTFDETCLHIQYLRENQDLTIDECKAMLHYKYIQYGNDWEGRGDIGHIIHSASIAAYEHMITEWEKEESLNINKN